MKRRIEITAFERIVVAIKQCPYCGRRMEKDDVKNSAEAEKSGLRAGTKGVLNETQKKDTGEYENE